MSARCSTHKYVNTPQRGFVCSRCGHVRSARRIVSEETLGKRVKFSGPSMSVWQDYISTCLTCGQRVLTLKDQGLAYHNRARATHRQEHVRDFLAELYKEAT